MVVRAVGERRAARQLCLEVRDVRCDVRCIHDQHVHAVGAAVCDQVVDDPAGLVRQQRVLRAAPLDPVEVVRERGLQERVRALAPHDQLAHVRDVEDPGRGAHGADLVDHARVLDRHLEPGERHDPPAESPMAVEERRALQRVGHRGSIGRGHGPVPGSAKPCLAPPVQVSNHGARFVLAEPGTLAPLREPGTYLAVPGSPQACLAP